MLIQTESRPKLTRNLDRKKDLRMKVGISVFGSRNMLRALGVSKIGWDELGWGYVENLQKVEQTSEGLCCIWGEYERSYS